MKKIIFTSILIIFLTIFNLNYSFAESTDTGTDVGTDTMQSSAGIWQQATEWMTKGKEANDNNQISYTNWSQLAGILWGVGIWTSIISGAILGIRFMIVTPEKKAQVKDSLMVWLIGTVIVIGALSIWNMMINLVDIY